jgi:hypothetical protein
MYKSKIARNAFSMIIILGFLLNVTNANANHKYELRADELISEFLNDIRKSRDHCESFITATISGVEFESESPNLLWAFRELVTGTAFNSTDTGAVNLQEIYEINPHCYDVICATEKIFGDGIGIRVLYLQAVHDLNASHIIHYDADKFTSSELDVAIEALQVIPKRLMPLERSKKFIRYKKGGAWIENGVPRRTVLANSNMEFYDSWAKKDKEMQKYVVIHEYAHNLAWRKTYGDYDARHRPVQRIQYLDRTQEWFDVAGWADLDTPIMPASTYITPYAMKSAAEDFADSVYFYIVSPSQLIKANQKKYDYIRFYVFGGQEFLPLNNSGPTVLDTFLEIAPSYKIKDPVHIEDVAKKCMPQTHLIKTVAVKEHILQCIDKKVIQYLLKVKYQRDAELIPIELMSPRTKNYAVHFPKVYDQVLQYAVETPGFHLYKKTQEPVATSLRGYIHWLWP